MDLCLKGILYIQPYHVNIRYYDTLSITIYPEVNCHLTDDLENIRF